MNDYGQMELYDTIYRFLLQQKQPISIIRLQMGVEIDLTSLIDILKLMSQDNTLKQGLDFEQIELEK